jgi:hypothetical protein
MLALHVPLALHVLLVLPCGMHCMYSLNSCIVCNARAAYALCCMACTACPAGRRPPVVMKLDVEGEEYAIFPGLMLSGQQ